MDKLIEINTHYDPATLTIEGRNLYSIQNDKRIFIDNISQKDIFFLPVRPASGFLMETNGEYVWFVSDRFPIFNGVPKFYELGLTKDRLVHQQDELIEYVSRRYKTKPCTYAGLQFLQYYANMLANTGGRISIRY